MRSIETEAQREAIGWALDVARDEAKHYLEYGFPEMDYADEWVAIAKERAKHMRALAELALYPGETESWSELADAYEHSAQNSEDLNNG